MEELIFGLAVTAWTFLAMTSFTLAGKKHGFSKVTVFAMSVISILGAYAVLLWMLEPNLIAAAIVACIAFEVGLQGSKRVSARWSSYIPD